MNLSFGACSGWLRQATPGSDHRKAVKHQLFSCELFLIQMMDICIFCILCLIDHYDLHLNVYCHGNEYALCAVR